MNDVNDMNNTILISSLKMANESPKNYKTFSVS